LRHLELAAAKFVGRMRFREHAGGSKELVEGRSGSGRRGMGNGSHRESL